jgi:uncharacterized protein (DUF58 family)
VAFNALTHIFVELRYYEDRARAEEETHETRLGTLVALSAAVLGLLAASLPDADVAIAGVVFFCIAVILFVAAILVATKFVIRLPLLARSFGGPLETVPEVGREEFDAYLTPTLQAADPDVLRRRSIPAMTAAVAARRRNVARGRRCLDTAIWLVASGVVSTATYAVNLAL